MKVLTLTQPWATLVAIGAKRIETRSWGTAYRGALAIHAAKKFPREAMAVCFDEPFRSVLSEAGIHTPAELPTASVLAVSELIECFRFDEETERKIRLRSLKETLPEFEAEFGDYESGRHGFVLDDMRKLETPVPARGMLGLWDAPADLIAALAEQTAEAA